MSQRRRERILVTNRLARPTWLIRLEFAFALPLGTLESHAQTHRKCLPLVVQYNPLSFLIFLEIHDMVATLSSVLYTNDYARS